MRVLFVCTGNLCRSPMAEGLLRRELEERGCAEVEVASAGTWAYAGAGATPDAVAVMAERDIDISGSRARALDPDEVGAADLVVAMTSVHVREIIEVAPMAKNKLVLLKELAEIEFDRRANPDAGGRLGALLGGRRPAPRRSLDVDDPMGLPLSSYQRCASELAAGIAVLADILCGEGATG